ncbi:DNA cytosine methyltransferase [Candidatus Poseidoniales archaeon]|nr:DNA cytosine methyltransferase [Candidatus Poseidoniales archaeon]
MDSLTWLKRKTKPSQKSPRHTLRSADFFSGCGGLSLGLWEAGRRCGVEIDVVLGLDMMKEAKPVFTDNFRNAKFIPEDISDYIDGKLGDKRLTKAEKLFKADIGNLDIILGGPPCQGNSDLNNHSRRDDPRNDLYLKMARAAYIFRPKIVLIENVQTVTRAKSNVVRKTKEFLENLDYTCEEFTIKASNLGLAQRRVRHFTLGIKEKVNMGEIVNSDGHRQERPISWAIQDLSEGASLFETPSTHQIQNKERIAWLFGEGWTDAEKKSDFNVGTIDKPEAYNLINSRRPRCHQNGHNYPAVYGRMKWNEAAPTITTGFGSTGQGRFVHPKEQRSLTPHEAARIQSFPDFFSFGMVTKRRALHTLIGNAVPPLMVVPLLVKVFNALEMSNTVVEPSL